MFYLEVLIKTLLNILFYSLQGIAFIQNKIMLLIVHNLFTSAFLFIGERWLTS